jgi:putative sterol carrier protein
MSDATIDPSEISVEEFAQLVANSSDQEIAETVHAAGTQRVLDRIFQVMEERFVPERAHGVDTTAQFTVRDGEEAHVYTMRIADGRCETARGAAESPNVSLETDLVNYLKLIAGKANGPMLFMGGKLKLSGDFMLAQRLMAFFDTPKA